MRRTVKPIKDSNPVALIDLDGTVANYDLIMNQEMKKIKSPGEVIDPDSEYMDNRRKLIKKQPGFFRNLPRIELGFQVVRLMREIGYDLIVLTKASIDCPNTWSEKVEWAREHLPDANITISQNKGLVYGRVLMDDWPEYYRSWLKHRANGLVIAIAQEWNFGETDHRVVRYDGNNLEQVKDLLERSFNRGR